MLSELRKKTNIDNLQDVLPEYKIRLYPNYTELEKIHCLLSEKYSDIFPQLKNILEDEENITENLLQHIGQGSINEFILLWILDAVVEGGGKRNRQAFKRIPMEGYSEPFSIEVLRKIGNSTVPIILEVIKEMDQYEMNNFDENISGFCVLLGKFNSRYVLDLLVSNDFLGEKTVITAFETLSKTSEVNLLSDLESLLERRVFQTYKYSIMQCKTDITTNNILIKHGLEEFLKS